MIPDAPQGKGDPPSMHSVCVRYMYDRMYSSDVCALCYAM